MDLYLVDGAQAAVRGAVGRWLAMPAGLPRLLLAGALQAGPLSLVARMVTFVGGIGPHDRRGAVLLFAFVLGTLIGPLLLLRRRGDDPVGQPLAFILLTVLPVALFLAAPRSGWLDLGACFAHGLGLGAIMTLFWGEMSAAIRDHARRTGIRTDLTAFALLTATIKLSGALFGLALGLLLDGFKADDPATMLALGAITVVGGLCYWRVGTPPRPTGVPALP